MSKISKSERLYIDQIQQLTGQTPLGASVSIINSFILSLVLWSVISSVRIIVWFSLILGISLIRIILHKRYKEQISDLKTAINRKNYFLIYLTVSGIVWGSAGIILFPSSSIGHQVFIAFVLGGMVAGSVGVYSALKTAFLAYSVPTLFPIIFMLSSVSDSIHRAMASMAGLFWLAMFITVKKLNVEVIKSLDLKYENIELVSSLRTEIDERKRVEEELKVRNREIEKIVQERTIDLQEVNRRLTEEIDERKETEIALLDNQKKYIELANSLPQIVFEADENGMLRFVNHNAFDVFGYIQDDAKDMISKKNIFDLVIPEDRDRASEEMAKVFNGETTKIGQEYTAMKKDGRTFPIAIHASPVISDGKPNGIRAIVIDLTEQKKTEAERKRLEAQLQRAQKMEAIGTLAGGVAHDLNNVLSGIVSYPDLLLMQIPDDSPLVKPIQTMKNSGNKAAAIVQDLLTLTRRGVVTKEVLCLNHIIMDYLLSAEFEKMILYHPGIQIEKNLEPDLLSISGSSIHLMKTVMNLVSNSVESMPDGGKLHVSTSNRYLDQPIKGYDHIKEGDYVVLTVSDTGIGISEKDLERVFEPFFTKKQMGRSGTGLGMAVIWNTVKDHDGYIDIESQQGKGTTITLYLPVTRKPLTDDESIDDSVELRGKGESILVIDDIEDQREIACVLLSQLGYHVSAVEGGEEAIEYLKTNSVDLLVLDMIMAPNMDGLKTYRKIIEMHPGQKAVIASGYSETERVREAQKLGAGVYIKKPYTLEKIGIAVRKELDK
jgi:two-component system cell cycle sensor histidine kinase/response regulator CckA